MNILVFSDSHGRTDEMSEMIRKISPDLILHLGDYDRDAEVLRKAFPHIPIRNVRGNCDVGSSAPELDNFTVEGKRIVMAHGHRYGVKYGLEALYDLVRLTEADVLLFGHTHIPHLEQIGEMYVVNPGAANRSCALVYIADGEVSCTHYAL